jgi:hypothetical protein
MQRVTLIILGIALSAAGGVIAYRALYLEPSAALVITNSQVRELPDYARVVGGTLLLVVGAVVAFLGVRKRTK